MDISLHKIVLNNLSYSLYHALHVERRYEIRIIDRSNQSRYLGLQFVDWCSILYIPPLFLQLNTVWVSCEGADPHDREVIGELNYYPESHGFPGYYYPYQNIPGYLSPLVAVHFLRPASK